MSTSSPSSSLSASDTDGLAYGRNSKGIASSCSCLKPTDSWAGKVDEEWDLAEDATEHTSELIEVLYSPN